MKKLITAPLLILSVWVMSQSTGALKTPALFTMDIIHDGGGQLKGEQWAGNSCTALDSLPNFKVVATAIVTYTDDSIHTTDLGRVEDAPCVFGVFDNGYNLFRDKRGIPWHLKMKAGSEFNGSTVHASVYYIYSDHGDLDPAFQQHFFVTACYPPPTTGFYNSASGNCFPEHVNYAVNGFRTKTAAEAGLTVTTKFQVKNNRATWFTVGKIPEGFTLESSTDGKVFTRVANIKAQDATYYNYSLEANGGNRTGTVVLGISLLLPLLFIRRKILPIVAAVMFISGVFVACKKDSFTTNTSEVKYYRLAQHNPDGTTEYINNK